MRITLSIPRSIVQYMDEVGVPMQERADLYERFADTNLSHSEQQRILVDAYVHNAWVHNFQMGLVSNIRRPICVIQMKLHHFL